MTFPSSKHISECRKRPSSSGSCEVLQLLELKSESSAERGSMLRNREECIFCQPLQRPSCVYTPVLLTMVKSKPAVFRHHGLGREQRTIGRLLAPRTPENNMTKFKACHVEFNVLLPPKCQLLHGLNSKI